LPKAKVPLKNRSVVDIMVLAFTFTVIFAIIVTGFAILIVEAVDSSAETTITQANLFNLVSTMLGALLGLLAGRSSRYQPFNDAVEAKEVLDDEQDRGP